MLEEPKDFNEAVEMLYKFTEQYRLDNNIHELNIDKAMPHHGFGTGVRNNWHLWWSDDNNYGGLPKPALVQWFNDKNIFHADDMSGTIQAALKAKLAGEDFDVDQHLKCYFEHWTQQGYKDGIYKLK